MTFETKYFQLQQAVKDLYLSAYWSADRDVDSKFLWEEVRDKADIPSNLTSSYLGEPQYSQTEKDLETALAFLYVITENPNIKDSMPTTTNILKKFLEGFPNGI